MARVKNEKTEAEPKETGVLQVLQKAAKGLLFPSESDRPVKPFLWQADTKEGSDEKADAKNAPPTVDALKAAAKIPDDAKIETVTPHDFFAPVVEKQDWFDAGQNETADKFQSLLDTLNKQVSDLSVFRVSGADADDASLVTAYVVGHTESGDLAGVTTQLVET